MEYLTKTGDKNLNSFGCALSVFMRVHDMKKLVTLLMFALRVGSIQTLFGKIFPGPSRATLFK